MPDGVDERADTDLDESESTRSENGSQAYIIDTSPQPFILSKRRWAILFAMWLLGSASALTGELGSILHTMLALLELPLDKYVYIQQFLSYISVISTFPTAWFIDRFGIRLAMYVTVSLMLIRDTTKALLFNPTLPQWTRLKLVYWITSMIASNQAMTIFYCLPLKISENWFATSERSVAWTVMMSSVNIGNSAAAFTYPRIVHQVKDVKPLFYLNLGAGIITSLVILCCITRSKPKHPPNERTTSSPHSMYFSSVKLIFRQRDIMLHLLHEAVFEGVHLSTLVVTQDILTSAGHEEIFVGNLMSINALVTVVLLISLATFVHRIKKITLACKVASLVRALLFIAYLNTMLYPLAGWIVIASAVIFYTSKSWALPNLNNMTAQLASGVVTETTIAGVAITLTVLTLTTSQVAFVQLISVTKDGKSDYTHSIMFASLVNLVNTLAYLTFFKGQTARRSCESDTNVEPSSV